MMHIKLYTQYDWQLKKKSLCSKKKTRRIHNTLKVIFGTFLVVQQLGIWLPVQGTPVWSLVLEDSTCHKATKPVYHNYWHCSRAGDVQLLSPYATTTEACVPQSLCSTTRDATTVRNLPPQLESSPCSQQPAKACTQQQRPSTAKKKYFLSDLWVINTHGIFFSIFSLWYIFYRF